MVQIKIGLEEKIIEEPNEKILLTSENGDVTVLSETLKNFEKQ